MNELPETTDAAGPWCPWCGLALRLSALGRYVYCPTQGCPCSEDGLEAPDSGDVAVEAQQAPAGWPRPVHDQRPVPWIAPVVWGEVDWAGLNMSRLRAAQRQRLCQVCGRELGEIVWFAAVEGEIAAGGALHEPCMRLASAVCPALSAPSTVLVEATRQADEEGTSALLARLVALEDEHGALPRVVSFVP